MRVQSASRDFESLGTPRNLKGEIFGGEARRAVFSPVLCPMYNLVVQIDNPQILHATSIRYI